MIEIAYLAAGSLIQFGGALITLQPQDSSNTIVYQFLAVFAGALLAGVINYFLQNRLLDKQRNGVNPSEWTTS